MGTPHVALGSSPSFIQHSKQAPDVGSCGKVAMTIWPLHRRDSDIVQSTSELSQRRSRMLMFDFTWYGGRLIPFANPKHQTAVSIGYWSILQ